MCAVCLTVPIKHAEALFKLMRALQFYLLSFLIALIRAHKRANTNEQASL